MFVADSTIKCWPEHTGLLNLAGLLNDIFYKWENNGVFSELSKSDPYYAKIENSLTFIYHVIVFPSYEEKQRYSETVYVYNEEYNPQEINYGADWEFGTVPFVEQNNSLFFVRKNDMIEISSFYERILRCNSLKKKYYVRQCPSDKVGFHIDSERIYKDLFAENIQIVKNPIIEAKDIIFLFKLKHHPNLTFSNKYKQVYPEFRDNPFALSYLSDNKLSPFPLIYLFTTFFEHATVLSKRHSIKSLFMLSHGRIQPHNEPIHRDFTQPHFGLQHNQELMSQFQEAMRSFSSYLPTGLLLNLYQYPLFTHTGTIYTEKYNNTIYVELHDFFQDYMESAKIQCCVTLFPVIVCIHDDMYVPDFGGGNIPGFYVKFDDENMVGYYMDCYENLDYLVAYNLTKIPGYDKENTQYPAVEYQPLGNADITWGYVPTFLHRFKQLLSPQVFPYYPFPNFHKYIKVYLESNRGYARSGKSTFSGKSHTGKSTFAPKHALTMEEPLSVVELDASIEKSESGLQHEVMEEEKSIEHTATIEEGESIIEHEATMGDKSVIEHDVTMEGDEVTKEVTDHVAEDEVTGDILESISGELAHKGKLGRRMKNYKSTKELAEILEIFKPEENEDKNTFFYNIQYLVTKQRERDKQEEKEKMKLKAKKAKASGRQRSPEIQTLSQPRIAKNSNENREIKQQESVQTAETPTSQQPQIAENSNEEREIIPQDSVPTTETTKFEIVTIPKSSEKRIIYKRESIEDDITFMRDYNKILRKNRKNRKIVDNPLNNYISGDTPKKYNKKITTTHREEVIYPSYIQDTAIETEKNAKFVTQQVSGIGDLNLSSGDKLKLRDVMMSVTRNYNQNMEDFFGRMRLGLIPEDEEPPAHKHKETKKIEVVRREESQNEENVRKSREVSKGLDIATEKNENEIQKPVEETKIVPTEKEPPKFEQSLKGEIRKQIDEPKVVESPQTRETPKKELKVSKREKSQQSATATEEKPNVFPLPSARGIVFEFNKETENLQKKLESEIMTAVEFVKKQVPNNTIHEILTCEETSTDTKDDSIMYDRGRSKVLKSVSQVGRIPDNPPTVQITRSETKEEIDQRKLEELQSQLKNEILDSIELIYQNTPKDVIKEILTGQGEDIPSESPPEFPKRQPRSIKDTAESPIEIVNLVPSERHSTKVIKKPKEKPEQGKLSLFFQESETEDQLSTGTVETDEFTNESTDSSADNFFCYDKKLLEDIYPMEYVDKLRKKVYEREFERSFDES